MRRLRFTSGLILGLILGIPVGLFIGLVALPTRAPDQNAATSLQIQELRRQLEASQEEKQHVDRQLEQFQKLAEQMTASFNSLERRFKALEEEQRLREAPSPGPVGQPPATPMAPQAQAPQGQTPQGQTPSDPEQPPAPDLQ